MVPGGFQGGERRERRGGGKTSVGVQAQSSLSLPPSSSTSSSSFSPTLFLRRRLLLLLHDPVLLHPKLSELQCHSLLSFGLFLELLARSFSALSETPCAILRTRVPSRAPSHTRAGVVVEEERGRGEKRGASERERESKRGAGRGGKSSEGRRGQGQEQTGCVHVDSRKTSQCHAHLARIARHTPPRIARIAKAQVGDAKHALAHAAVSAHTLPPPATRLAAPREEKENQESGRSSQARGALGPGESRAAPT
eukprot:826410-Rhodomonas_salina.2